MTAVQNTTISLNDFHNSLDAGLSYFWFVSTACPAGQEYHLNLESDGDDYCDLVDTIHNLSPDDLFDLRGTVVNGRWEWNGNGEPSDIRGNSILNITAF